jgi:hypothetical protein
MMPSHRLIVLIVLGSVSCGADAQTQGNGRQRVTVPPLAVAQAQQGQPMPGAVQPAGRSQPISEGAGGGGGTAAR